MPHAHVRKVNYAVSGGLHPVEQVFLFATHQVSAVSAKLGVEFTHCIKHAAAKAHIGPDREFPALEIAHSLPHVQSGHPAQRPFAQPFRRLAAFEGRDYSAPERPCLRMSLHILGQSFHVPFFGDGVVVQKDEQIALRRSNSAVPCPRKPLLFLTKDAQRKLGVRALKVLDDQRRGVGRVIVYDYGLEIGVAFPRERFQNLSYIGLAIICADNYRNHNV